MPLSQFLKMREMIAAVGKQEHNILDKLEAMTAVCSGGLDMIALPGDIFQAQLPVVMIADEAAIGMINNKTTASTLVIPVPGKKSGPR